MTPTTKEAMTPQDRPPINPDWLFDSTSDDTVAKHVQRYVAKELRINPLLITAEQALGIADAQGYVPPTYTQAMVAKFVDEVDGFWARRQFVIRGRFIDGGAYKDALYAARHPGRPWRRGR